MSKSGFDIDDLDLEIDYEAVLRDLRAKRDKLDGAIRGLEAMLGFAPASGTPGPSGGTRRGTLSDDTFLGMTTPMAALEYLKIIKKPQTTPEIASALLKHGIHSTSDKFTNTVYTALHRSDEAIRVGKKWSLKEWHPNMRVHKKRGQDDEAGSVEEGAGDDQT